VTIQGDPPQATALAKQVVDDLIPRWPSRGIGVNGSPQPSTSHIVRTLAKKASADGMEDGGAGLTPELRIVKLLLEKLFDIKVKSISLPDTGPDAEHAPDRSERQAYPTAQQQGWGLEYTLHEPYLASLRQRGIGAIYLGRERTPFALKDAQNNLQGESVASGVYLREDGTAGSIQQVNLVA